MIDKIKQKLTNLWTKERAIIVGIVIIVGGWMLMTIQVLNNNYNLQRQVDNSKLDNQITELENQNLQLEQMYYQTDEYMELSARSLLGKALPGENMVILPRIEHDNDVDNDGQMIVTKTNLDQWLDFLFGQH